jgi:hypothetical protein
VTPNPQEGNRVARSTLETIFLDQLGTKPQNDNSKNDLDSSEQIEGMGQPKIDISMAYLPANVNPSPASPSRTKTPSTDEDHQEANSPGHTGIYLSRKLREPTMEHLYMIGCLGNTMSQGDKHIPEPVDEVTNIKEIYYDRKIKVVMRRTIKKRKVMLDRTLIIATKEMLFDTKNDNMTKLLEKGWP